MNKKKIIWAPGTMLNPVPCVLVGCGNGQEYPFNLLTIGWAGTVCSEPPQVGIGIRPERFSYGLIAATGEFTVNLPSAKLAPAVDFCGVTSGRDVDKFAVRNLTAVPGEKVSAPLVAECPIALECKVTQKLELGSHHLFIGEVLAVQVNEDLVDEKGRLDIVKADLLSYAHGQYFRLEPKSLGHFGFSIRKKPLKR